ncbi:helix-turn-helix domain-containing protein [Streptomyces sp. MS19]|uniref:helix-turn-helix domain-containing protein n=1 Tax=Streptomyces sp. MS19 TaxID=3385972 RepID=UPI0039A2773B
MAKPQATVRRYLLGMELKRLRSLAKVTQSQAGQVIDADDSKMSRIESGTSSISRPELAELLRLYGVSADEEIFDFLITLNRESRKHGWWYQHRGAIPPSVLQLIELEATATAMYQFSPAVVPGLLQTEDYARALIGGLSDLPPEDIDAAVSVRMSRQRILDDANGPELTCVLDEAAVRRQIGSSKVQREQLMSLLERAASPTLTVRVVPHSQGVHAAIDGGFKLFTYPTPTMMEFAFIEYLGGHLFLEGDTDVQRFKTTVRCLDEQALSSEDSLKLISRIARDVDS